VLWNVDNQVKACQEGGEKMIEKCAQERDDSVEEEVRLGIKSEKCNPCAHTVAYMFAKYERYAETIIHNMIREISQKQAQNLSQEGKNVNGNNITGNKTLKA
jgi:hypothetical protein